MKTYKVVEQRIRDLAYALGFEICGGTAAGYWLRDLSKEVNTDESIAFETEHLAAVLEFLAGAARCREGIV